MRNAIAMTLVLGLAFPAAAWAQASEEDRGMVCMGDALQLCSEFIPDHEAIKGCLRAKHAQLSPGCRTVLDGSQRRRRPKAS